MSARPPLGWVRIVATDPKITVQARLSADRPNVEQGYGGWTEVARPRRRPLTVWTGSPALRLTLPLLLDRWADGKASVERQIAQLERLGEPSASDGQPPRVRFVARGGAVPHQERTWVVDAIAFGDALMNRAGDRARQQLTLSLLEYIADIRVDEDSSAGRRRRQTAAPKTKAGAASKRIVAGRNSRRAPGPGLRAAGADDEFGEGEDLLAIAARELGDADRWLEIAQLNGLRDPRAIRPGQVLRLP